jgi:chemosensory pili system protein ChpA (sensor histidine kinase/response regulator)
LDGQRSVLIVDPSDETREVLQTALERRGLRIFAAGAVREGLELARSEQPDLIVVDIEAEDSAAEAFSAPFTEQSRTAQTPLVLLGSLRRGWQPPRGGEFVSKPYHYGPLIRRIEEILGSE